MGHSPDSGRPDYSYEEVKAFIGNARLPRNPAEAQTFACEDAYKQGKIDGRKEVIVYIETNFLNIQNPVWLHESPIQKLWESQCEEWQEAE